MILASGSPRRQDLLKAAGLHFSVIKADVDEQLQAKSPQAQVMGLAFQKALAVAKDHEGDLVLGADTLVYLEGRPLGKPKDRQEAEAMLKALSGKTHQVYTGFAFVKKEAALKLIDYDMTQVTFKDLTDQAIQDYLAREEWSDKAGAYGIQGLGKDLVDHIEGDLDTVIGLPLKKVVKTYQDLETLAYD